MSVEEAQVVVENHELRTHAAHDTAHAAIAAALADLQALSVAEQDAIANLTAMLSEHTGSYHAEAPTIEELPVEPEEPVPEEPDEPEQLPEHRHALLRRVGRE